jgi:TolB-like protein
MASIIEGYEYDIFISYRQKDNKHDGWITEFVDNLKGELESTFKEDISIYFDENPHDGLLETHSVDKSLEGKLKCLIFIPVISQTYCDSKSFAWQHEFCAFNKIAKEDPFGRDVKLTSGNVASRILPVKIHDLDPEDKTLLENELGGVLRCIEFIYKETGVNRPLKPNDDAKENLNKTHYVNQVNKVANAVKEMISALQKQSHHPEEVSKQDFEVKPTHQKNLRTKIIIASVLILALIILGCFFIPKLFNSSKKVEKSIAVLPFINDSPDQENAYFINGIMDEILNNLQKIRNFRVLSRTSTEQYRGSTKSSLPKIAKELDVNYLVEGSGQKYGNSYHLRVQLIEAKNDKHLWAESYEKEIQETKDIYGTQSQIAQAIAAALKATISPDERQLIEKSPTANLTAYDLYMKANGYQKDYEKTQDLNTYQKAATLYKAALELDSAFAKAYTGLAWAYINRYYYVTYFKENFLDSCLVLANIALSYDDQLDEAYFLKGVCYEEKGNFQGALDNYDKALIINPNYYWAYYYEGSLFTWEISDFVKGIDNFQKALNLMHGDERTDLLWTLGAAYLNAGFIEKAKYYGQEAFALNGNKASISGYLGRIEFNLENFEEALKLVEKANEIDSTNLTELMYYSVPSGHSEEAYVHAKKLIQRSKKSGALNLNESHRIGYAFWQVGKKKEAEYYFTQQIKYCEESIKLGRALAQIESASYDLAGTYAFLGDKVKAYQYLDEFNKKKNYPLWWVILAKHDPLFDSIRDEERFQKILNNMEEKYQAEHERVKKWLESQGML